MRTTMRPPPHIPETQRDLTTEEGIVAAFLERGPADPEATAALTQWVIAQEALADQDPTPADRIAFEIRRASLLTKAKHPEAGQAWDDAFDYAEGLEDGGAAGVYDQVLAARRALAAPKQ